MIINLFQLVTHTAQATVTLAQDRLLPLQTSNTVQTKVEVDNLLRRIGQ